MFLAPSAGVSASGYRLKSGHGSGWKLPPPLSEMQMDCSMRNLPKKGEILISEVLSSPPTLLDAGGFLPLTPQKVSSGFSFLYIAHLFTMMLLAWFFIHSLSHIVLKKMSSHCSNQCLCNGCIIPNDTMSRLNTFLNTP